MRLAQCLQLWRVNLRRNRANLRDDAAMHLSFAREDPLRDVEFVDVLVSPPGQG